MAVPGVMFRIFNAAGQFRNRILNRNTLALYQQNTGYKQKIEDKLGLPLKPKKPMTTYLRFLNKIRPELLRKNPHIKQTDIPKLASERWKNLDATSKEQLQAEFKHDMEEYKQLYKNYKEKLTDEQKEALELAKTEVTQLKERKQMKLKMKELGRPKRPMTGYLMFMSECQSQRGNVSYSEWHDHITKEWLNLPEDKKAVYNARSKEAFDAYKRDMQTWEEKMIRLGHIEVVRNEALIGQRPDSTKLPRRRKQTEE